MRINKNLTRPHAVIAVTAAALSVLSCGCKGRTADNMTPTGDTVEVVINPDNEAAVDSIASNDSTANEI